MRCLAIAKEFKVHIYSMEIVSQESENLDFLIRSVRRSYNYWGIQELTDEVIESASIAEKLLTEQDYYGWSLYYHIMYFQGDEVALTINARVPLFNDLTSTKARCFCFRPSVMFCAGFLRSSCQEHIRPWNWCKRPNGQPCT